MDCQTFSDWGELKASLIRRYGLEDVSIQLRPDFVGSGSVESLDRMEVREETETEVLLSLSVGLRASLVVHLLKDSSAARGECCWLPRDECRAVLMCAKGVFCRNVRDRVVDLMSSRGRNGVVSFFLDAEGRVESASSLARAFCDEYFPASNRIDDYFPQSHWDYLQGTIKMRESLATLSYKNESLVFCFLQDRGIVDCLLQKMGENGYLLSLSVDQ